MVKKSWLFVLVGVFLISLVMMGFLMKIDFERKEYNKFEDRGVPRINIRLNGVNLEEVDSGDKDRKYEGNELFIYDNFMINEYFNVIIKGRGNGTWMQEKKPYQIKFDYKVDLFGMGKAKKWYLLANAMDETSVRTDSAIYLSKMLGMNYVVDGRFVELYVNNNYRGLYYLTHAVEISKSVVDLRDPMGILVELDNLYWGGEKSYDTRNGEKLVVKDVVSKENEEVAAEDFINVFNELELAIKEKDYKKIENLIDIDSFARYYLLSEFIVNPDAYWTSFYFYKDGMEDKIHAGPAWDFDLSFGSRRWGNWMGERFYSPTETMARKIEILEKPEAIKKEEESSGNYFPSEEVISRIMFDLMEIPEFVDRVKKIFSERMSGRKMELIYAIYSAASKVDAAASKNESLWGGDYKHELDKMLDWVNKRYDYFEEMYGNS